MLRAFSAAEPTPPTLPPCAHVGEAISLPSEFPKSLPLPPGTVITASKPSPLGTVLTGLIPMELGEAKRFFAQKLPAAGFRLGLGDVGKDEAEARFGGNGIIGYFKIRNIPDCSGVLELTIRAQPMPSVPLTTPPAK